ncbi:cell division protein FtsL [Methylovulum psychrotolerans]|jgi:cell division protein FtsL|uniref:Cell division protein FtsL n=1 Tax=Methylovulum psychrotolerans TaxID=1704499 RepID=A0A1Z4C008_9GAMM|nr:cell division protein FtsL [Methylovulum psychrotolerans]ASF46868.1 cell division protein FtsL [Methylovulum psychrotolerans]MBT9098930.1 cell division protein FtsL [Methylovulum psychrotolerans]POZ50318.1 cell division protein FtsL [Methylovulum psychrotolerans]
MAGWRVLGMGSLFVALLVSAIAVVYYQYRARLVFIEIQQQQAALDQYEIEWGQMQLEITMLLEENRVESAALNQLKLILPKREETIYLKP